MTSASEGDSLPPSCACEPFKKHARQSVNHSISFVCVAKEKSPRATRRRDIHIIFRSFPRRRRSRTRANDETSRGEINQFVHSARATRTQTDDGRPTGIRHPSQPSIHPPGGKPQGRSATILTNDDADDEKEDVPRGRRQRISSFFISSCLCGEFVAEEANVPALASGSRSKRCAHKRRSRTRRLSVFFLIFGKHQCKSI